MVYRIGERVLFRKWFQNSPGNIDSTPCVPAIQPAPCASEKAEPSWQEGGDKPNESWPQSLFA